MQDCEESKDLQESVISSPDVIFVERIGKQSPISKFRLEGKKSALFDYEQKQMAGYVIPESPEEKIL